jgi:hypothetical protein
MGQRAGEFDSFSARLRGQKARLKAAPFGDRHLLADVLVNQIVLDGGDVRQEFRVAERAVFNLDLLLFPKLAE